MATENEVKGYTPQSLDKIERVNNLKVLEEVVMRQLDLLLTEPAIDLRWLAIGRTHIQLGFMGANRSIFNPQRIELTVQEEEMVQGAPSAGDLRPNKRIDM